MTSRLKSLSVQSVLGIFRTRYSLLFWLMLIVLFAFEIWIAKEPVMSAVKSSSQEIESKRPSVVRVNFSDYAAIADRMNKAKDFKPLDYITRDPFSNQAAPVSE